MFATQPWHAVPSEKTVAAVESDAARGLTQVEADRRLAACGANALPEPAQRSVLAVFFRQFRSPLIYLLFVAAGVALALGETGDATVIGVVVVLNALIGAIQEGRAERSLAALRRLSSLDARVIRDGAEKVVAARNVVPGDILLVAAGDAIAADARLLDGAALQIAEAALTGESVPVSKDSPPLPADSVLADRRNMVYAGTHVTAGRARAIVVATGTATEIGGIARMAQAVAEPATPLERRIRQFGNMLIVGATVAFAVILLVGIARGLPLAQIIMIGISQLVGMVPEGLPVAVTIALAVGVQRMAKRRAIVRRLAAVETLGSTTVICTDKTGTLTRNEMTVTELSLPGGRRVSVTGSGFDPRGEMTDGGTPIDAATDDRLLALLQAGVLCNDAQLSGPHDEPPRWRPMGDPTEVALVSLAIKSGLIPAEVRAQSPRDAELPFDADAKMMATQHGERVVIKGAPEAVLALCSSARVETGHVPLDPGLRNEALAAADSMARRALRVLAVAVADKAAVSGETRFDGLRGRATLLGLIGQIDLPRPEVADAVARCRAAGVRPVMVTGDHRATGLAIARQLGIASERDEAIDGAELARITDDELDHRLPRISVFARVHPAQKLRIVEALSRQGDVVAMTGDGVNDAPALSKADAGVAMGSGTEVAKEASKIVLVDDNFATLVAAVSEGRVVYQNIKKAIVLLFSTSLAEVLVLLLAMVLGYPPPFAAVQILWNNLVTEGVITVNLAMEPPEGDEMRRPPIPRDEPLLTRALVRRIALLSPAIVASTLGWFLVRLQMGVPVMQVQSETFTLLAVCEWFNVLNCRSERQSALTLSVFGNPYLIGGLIVGNLLQVAVIFWAPLRSVFHTTPFGPEVVLGIGIVGSLVLWIEELRKLLLRRREHAGGTAQPLRGDSARAQIPRAAAG